LRKGRPFPGGLFVFLRPAVHVDEPQMNGMKLRHEDEQNGARDVPFGADKMGLFRHADIFSRLVKNSFAALPMRAGKR